MQIPCLIHFNSSSFSFKGRLSLPQQSSYPHWLWGADIQCPPQSCAMDTSSPSMQSLTQTWYESVSGHRYSFSADHFFPGTETELNRDLASRASITEKTEDALGPTEPQITPSLQQRRLERGRRNWGGSDGGLRCLPGRRKARVSGHRDLDVEEEDKQQGTRKPLFLSVVN